MKATLFYRAIRYFLRKIREIFYSVFFRKFYENDSKALIKLKDIHKGKPAILIGGGPSINKMDLDQFKDHITIACNGFFLKMENLNWSPTYYTVEDPLPAEDNSFEISNLKSTTKLIPYDLKKYIKPDSKTIYTNFLRSYMRPTRKKYPLFSFDCEKEVFWGGTVMYYNIQLAAYMGCNPIYLTGVDLSYNIPSSVKKAGAVLTSTEEDSNHFDPRYFGEGKRWHLPETERMQASFTKAHEELAKKGIKLINAGFDSNLKVIPKETLFNEI